ncbi:DUF362 domain-containing protein [Candidatus Uhrbacteria bacterium]|nr:DUF362 domain-containing protein [Candidatus Uhrbacteria bacterium]
MSKVHIFSVMRGSTDDETIKSIRQTANYAFDGFSWLMPGEAVWLKVALNSKDPHPATTDWRAIRAVADEIQMRGGRVVVADQSGIEYDKEGNALTSPSEYCFGKSGMAECGEKFLALENHGFERLMIKEAAHWPDGFRVSRLLLQVDHIINLPRISGHGQASESLGAKNWVGALYRNDRYQFHAQGPLYWYIRWIKMGSSEKLPAKSQERHFDEMIAELALAFRHKLRGTLFAATKVQTTLGPNKHLLTFFGRIGLFKSCVLEPETGLIIASDDQVAADATALAFLFECYERTPWFRRFLQWIMVTVNGRIRLPGYDIWTNPVIARQLELKLGERPTALIGHNMPASLFESLQKKLGINHRAF